MRRVMGLFGVGVALLVVIGLATWAAATPQASGVLRTLYTPKDGSDLAKALPCLACHTAVPGTKTNLNPYGVDLLKAGKGTLDEKAFKAVEGLDSDKDGVKNGVELKAGTLPGDPKSKPK